MFAVKAKAAKRADDKNSDRREKCYEREMQHCFYYAESQIKKWNVWIFCASSVKCSKLISSADH